MATNAARYRMVAGKNIKLLEFGLRRAQGPDGGLSASKYSYIGKFKFIYFHLLVSKIRMEGKRNDPQKWEKVTLFLRIGVKKSKIKKKK